MLNVPRRARLGVISHSPLPKVASGCQESSNTHKSPRVEPLPVTLGLTPSPNSLLILLYYLEISVISASTVISGPSRNLRVEVASKPSAERQGQSGTSYKSAPMKCRAHGREGTLIHTSHLSSVISCHL